MVCGQRAYRHMQRIFEENRAVSQAFSVPVEATGSGAQKMVQTLAAAKADIARLQGLVFASIAEKYAGQSRVVHFEEGLEPGQVRNLADRIASVTGEFCMVYSGSDGACSYCLAARQGDLRELNRQLCAALQGRGGGKPNFQQGSLRCSIADVQDFFRN
jgi:alanyl-tRNA synthetase